MADEIRGISIGDDLFVSSYSVDVDGTSIIELDDGHKEITLIDRGEPGLDRVDICEGGEYKYDIKIEDIHRGLYARAKEKLDELLAEYSDPKLFRPTSKYMSYMHFQSKTASLTLLDEDGSIEIKNSQGVYIYIREAVQVEKIRETFARYHEPMITLLSEHAPMESGSLVDLLCSDLSAKRGPFSPKSLIPIIKKIINSEYKTVEKKWMKAESEPFNVWPLVYRNVSVFLWTYRGSWEPEAVWKEYKSRFHLRDLIHPKKDPLTLNQRFHPRFQPGVQVGSFYFIDTNGDHLIDEKHDEVYWYETVVGEPMNFHPSLSLEAALEDLEIDSKEWKDRPIPLTQVHQWASENSSTLWLSRQKRDNPMEDGVYKVLIAVPNSREIRVFFNDNYESWYLSSQAYLNGFDDVIVVDEDKGFRGALSQLAREGLPIHHLTILTHNYPYLYSQLELDAGLSSPLADGATILWSGCDQTEADIALVARTISAGRDSTIIWADGTNLPLFGLFFSTGPIYRGRVIDGHLEEIEGKREDYQF